jgi:thiol-disulfide isomerase/thioredoxin
MSWKIGTIAMSLMLCLRARGEEPAPAPEFPKESTWLQSDPLRVGNLRGRVVVVHFWTFGCINCQHNYPVYKAWQEKYKDAKLTIIGVHSPETKAEKDVERVKAKAKANGLKFPIVIDNDLGIWKAWRVRYWPSIFLIDKQGKVRYYWEGELHLDEPQPKRFAAAIDELLAEND